MSIKESVISLVIKAKNLLSGDADDAADSLEGLKAKTKDLRDNLKLLEDQQKLITQFGKQQKAVDKTQASYELLTQRTESLRKKIAETSDPTGKLNVQLERSEAAANKAAQSLSGQNIELNKLKNSLNSNNISVDKLTQNEERLTREIKNNKTVLAGYSKTMRDMGTSTAETEKSASKFSLAKAAFWTAGILAVRNMAGELKSLAASVFTTGDKFEGLRIQMNAVMGSIEGGETATEWIKEFTKNTPLQLEEVTETFARMKAFGLDPMDGSMQAIIDQSEKLGGGMDRVQSISLALGQAWAKQKLQGDEILQLIERGVPVWDLLEKATGRNTIELQKLSTEGKLGRDVIKALTDEIGKSADGAAAANMSRLTGIVSNLKDEWQAFFNMIAESGALDYAKAQLIELADTVKKLGADGTLKKWAQEISDAFINVVNTTKGVVTKIYELKDEIALLGAVALKVKLASMFVGFTQTCAQAVASMGGVSSATNAATIRAKAFASVLKGALYLAVAEASIQIYKLGNAFVSMRQSQDAATESLDLQKKTIEELAATYKKYSDQVGIAITSTDQWEQLINDGLVTFNEAKGIYERTNTELERQSVLQQNNADVLANSLLPATERLNGQFAELMQNGSSVTDAIGEITASLDIDNTQSIDDVITVLSDLKDKSQITASEIEVGLRRQLGELSSKELAAIYNHAGNTFSALGVDIRSVINDVDPLRKEFDKLGLDLNLLRNGFTETGKDALLAFAAITKAATATGQDIGNAFDGAIARTNTTSELNALKKQITDLGTEGKLSGDLFETMLQKIDDKLSDLTPGVGSLEKAFNDLGIASKAELEKTAEASKKAFEAINESTAAVADKQRAFVAYASAAIEANDGVVSAEIRIQAAVLGVTDLIIEQGVEIDKNTDKWINRGSEAVKASESIVAAAIRERNATRESNEAVSQLNSGSLSNLRSEIGSTTIMMNELKSASELAIDALELELLAAQGKQDEIDAMEHQSKIDAIQDQVNLLNQLARSGVEVSAKEIADLKTQKRLLQQIYDAKQQSAAAESVSTTTATQSTVANETVSVVLNIGTDSATITTDQQGKDDLLSLLENSQLVTT